MQLQKISLAGVQSLVPLLITFVATVLTPFPGKTAEIFPGSQMLAQTPEAPATVNPLNIEQIRQVAKEHNATLVEYSINYETFPVQGKEQTQESELLIWVVQPTGEITLRRVDLRPLWQKQNTSLSELVSSSRAAMGIGSAANKSGIFVTTKQDNRPSKQLQQLHQLLVEPIAELLPKAPNARVAFIPQKSLFLLPFAALQDKQGKYLIEQHAIFTAPSIQALDLLYKHRQRIQGIAKDVLVVGNPTMPRVPPKIGQKPVLLQQLPGAEQEANAIANLFNTQALIGDAATETAIVQQMPQARIIHLATTGLIDEEEALRNAIALAPSNTDDGLLTAEEILNLKLNAELVVLSACDAGLGRITEDGVIGLTRSFLAAGVPSAIAPLGLIPDEPTAFLMTEFYKNLQSNPDKAVALQNAMLATMKQHPNPMNWAGFILIGEP
ncbi:CHAT domain-containing protein [Coleofasciculus sp. FACHB-SPT9]|uniref:CHAT domain-containing protein n=1 Tax=Cyanophyceae TaxID=3028117 RepID=UPI001688733B|nr:CHAT domain-containing protein [Coleofasciculus sp. FACHB-SPT9]MBD1891587.1 CHAT domain-containing protein [Coleofasciculus sp. FACHB-SPT9]